MLLTAGVPAAPAPTVPPAASAAAAAAPAAVDAGAARLALLLRRMTERDFSQAFPVGDAAAVAVNTRGVEAALQSEETEAALLPVIQSAREMELPSSAALVHEIWPKLKPGVHQHVAAAAANIALEDTAAAILQAGVPEELLGGVLGGGVPGKKLHTLCPQAHHLYMMFSYPSTCCYCRGASSGASSSRSGWSAPSGASSSVHNDVSSSRCGQGGTAFEARVRETHRQPGHRSSSSSRG